MELIQVSPAESTHVELFTDMLLAYLRELDEHSPDPSFPDETIRVYAAGMSRMQGSSDRHLELCLDGGAWFGFHCDMAGHTGHKGFNKPSYGCIMEIYVAPGFRRKGYGTRMLARLSSDFFEHDVENLYLTADPVSGEPFFEALDFRRHREIYPKNNQKIYEKKIKTRSHP